MNLFDLHADTPMFIENGALKNSSVDLINHPFKTYIQTMAVFIRSSDKAPFDSYLKGVKNIKEFSAKNKIPLIKKSDFSKSGVLISVENAGFLGEDIDRIHHLSSDGVKMLSLTWNEDNSLASGANGNGGISKKGYEVIKKLNSLKIALDVSHLSHKSTLEGIEAADFVLASHSDFYSINPHKRNIKDEALLALKEKNGIIGICFYPEFLGSQNVVLKIKEHIEYLISLGMEDNIALGSDFDGAEMSEKLSTTKDVLSLYNKLLNLGLKKTLLDKIFYENAIAFFSKICENKYL